MGSAERSADDTSAPIPFPPGQHLEVYRETETGDTPSDLLKLLREREQAAEAKQLQADRLIRLYQQRLRTLAGVDASEARRLLTEEVRQSSAEELADIRREMLFQTEQQAREEARRILCDAMQRLTTNPERQLSAALVTIPNEQIKGRVIGREGRNIRAFETVTGVTLMIDDTPGSILVSSFDPVRREIARRTLEWLVEDGRIHPAAIEETFSRVSEEMRDTIYAYGENALMTLRLGGVPPEMVALLGSLHFRLSNNQNTLDHSVEVAFLAGLIAAELGLDQETAKRVGLFHDLGKALDQEHGGSHAKAAANLLRRYGEPEVVINAVEASHGEVAPASLYAEVLKIADAASAARPGARTDSLSGFLQRVRSLEKLALGFRGVVDAYAIQAGREIRVVVKPESITDADARTLARNLRRRIEDELSYPGEIKVTVIREQRFSETAT